MGGHGFGFEDHGAEMPFSIGRDHGLIIGGLADGLMFGIGEVEHQFDAVTGLTAQIADFAGDINEGAAGSLFEFDGGNCKIVGFQFFEMPDGKDDGRNDGRGRDGSRWIGQKHGDGRRFFSGHGGRGLLGNEQENIGGEQAGD